MLRFPCLEVHCSAFAVLYEYYAYSCDKDSNRAVSVLDTQTWALRSVPGMTKADHMLV